MKVIGIVIIVIVNIVAVIVMITKVMIKEDLNAMAKTEEVGDGMDGSEEVEAEVVIEERTVTTKVSAK